jgi:hypothetical protein
MARAAVALLAGCGSASSASCASGRTYVLGTAGADAQGSVDTTVQVPDDVPKGPAVLVVGPSGSIAVQVTAPWRCLGKPVARQRSAA